MSNNFRSSFFDLRLFSGLLVFLALVSLSLSACGDAAKVYNPDIYRDGSGKSLRLTGLKKLLTAAAELVK